MDRADDRNRSAFEALVNEHHIRVRAFVRSLGVDPDWVDDLAQEAFPSAYREWDSFDESRDFGRWIRGIALNLVRSAANVRQMLVRIRRQIKHCVEMRGRLQGGLA